MRKIRRAKDNLSEYRRSAGGRGMPPLFLALALALSFLIGSLGQAEVYVAGQAGGSFPDDLRNVKGTGTIHGITFNDLDLANTLVYGAKAGYFFEDKAWQWVGVELDLFTSNPHVKRQSITAPGGGATASALGNGAHVRTLVTALNVIARYQARYQGTRIEPYAGVGLAFVHAKVSDETFSDSDASPGLNLLAGLKGFISENVALFGEFKYTYTSFQLDDAGLVGSGIKGVYAAPALVGGVSWHFR